MAHTDACKFQVCQFVGKIMNDGGLSLREAAKKAQEESDGIPAGTIRRWWAESKQDTNERFKNEPPAENAPTVGDACGKVVTSGDKLTPEKIVEKVDAKIGEGWPALLHGVVPLP